MKVCERVQKGEQLGVLTGLGGWPIRDETNTGLEGYYGGYRLTHFRAAVLHTISLSSEATSIQWSHHRHVRLYG